MNKLLILLLSSYIGFMACKVKKQIHRSTMLTDSLLRIASSNIDQQTASRDIAGITVDSLYANTDWKALWIDSLLRGTPDRNTIGIYGVRWVSGRQKVAGIARSATAENAVGKRIRTSVDSALLHTRSQKTILDTRIEKSPKRGWWYLSVALLVLAAAWYLCKKIFRFC